MNPTIDYHALAPEIVLTGTIVVCLLVDLFLPSRPQLVPRIASIGVLGALIPVLTLAADGTDRSMFGGAFVVDNYALVFRGFFLVVAYVTLLLSFDDIAEGDYYRGRVLRAAAHVGARPAGHGRRRATSSRSSWRSRRSRSRRSSSRAGASTTRSRTRRR